MRRFGLSCFVLCVLVVSALPADAQVRRTYWGVEAAVVPKWRVPSWQEALFDASTLDLAGLEFRLGVVRSQILGSDWGVSYVYRTINDKAAAVVDNDGEVISTNGNTIAGVEIGGFAPFKTFRQRFQIGLGYGVGAGFYRGTVQVTHPNGTTELVPAKRLFSPGSDPFPLTPLARIELAGTFIASPNFKIRLSGGVNFPGQHAVSASAIYVFAPR